MGAVELRQLVYFDAIVRYGGFTRAAQNLHVAQPAISSQIRKLEHELGVQLLVRSPRGVVVTEAGAQLLEHARAALSCVADLTTTAAEHRGVDYGSVRIGATPLTGGVELSRALADYRGRYPNVRLTLRSGLAAELIEALVQGELDLVVAPEHDFPDSAITLRRLSREKLVMIAPVHWDARPGALADILDEQFICLPANSGLRRLLDTAFSAFDREPSIVFETHSPVSIREMVSNGVGIALVAESIATAPGHPVSVFHLDGLPAHPPICAYSPVTPTNPAAARFTAELVTQPPLRGVVA